MRPWLGTERFSGRQVTAGREPVETKASVPQGEQEANELSEVVVHDFIVACPHRQSRAVEELVDLPRKS
jgi:hypothetical protein